MGIIGKGIIGGIKGKIGNIVGYRRLGTDQLRYNSTKNKDQISPQLDNQITRIRALFSFTKKMTATYYRNSWQNFDFGDPWAAAAINLKIKWIDNSGVIDYDNLTLGNEQFSDSLIITEPGHAPLDPFQFTVSNLLSKYPSAGGYSCQLHQIGLNYDFNFLTEQVIHTDTIILNANNTGLTTGKTFYWCITVQNLSTGATNIGYCGTWTKT